MANDLSLEDSEAERLRELRSEFKADWKHEQRWRKMRRECAKYYDGYQFTNEELETLRKRNQPPIVVNLIKPRIDAIQGMFLSVPIMMRAFDRGSGDFETAKYVTEALRFNEDRNDFNEVEREATLEQLISGRAWYEVAVDFDLDDIEFKLTAPDTEDIVKHRDSVKQDLSDCNRLSKTFWVRAKDLKKQYPKAKKFIEDAVTTDGSFDKILESHMTKKLHDQYAVTDDNTSTAADQNIFADTKAKRLRIIQMYYRESVIRRFGIHDSLEGGRADITDFTPEQMSQFEELYPDAEVFTKKGHKLNSVLFIENKILEEKEDIRPHDTQGKYPLVQMLGYQENNDTKMPYGYVRQLKDPQDAYNKSRSKTVHKNNSKQIIAEQDAVEDWEDAKEQVHRPDGLVITRPDKKFEVNAGQVNAADISLINLALQEMQGVGLPNELTGQEDKTLSGKAIQLRQSQGLQPLRTLVANQRKARKRIFTILLEEMQRYWTSEKLVKITDDPRAEGVVLNKVETDENGNEVILNDLSLGKYDIKIDEAPQTENARSETFDKLMGLVERLLQMGVPVPLNVFLELIKSSDVPNKDGIVQSLVEQQQAQAQAAQAGAA